MIVISIAKKFLFLIVFMLIMPDKTFFVHPIFLQEEWWLSTFYPSVRKSSMR